MNSMREVGGVAHATHARASTVDEVNPFVKVIIAFHLDLQSLVLAIVVTWTV
jgi:hypothetical protein